MFTEFGYYKEFYVGNKFIGTVDCEKDREVFGHFGAQKEIVQTAFVLKNKKKIKACTEVMTMIFPYCGIKTK